jgi:hypothetical protein
VLAERVHRKGSRWRGCLLCSRSAHSRLFVAAPEDRVLARRAQLEAPPPHTLRGQNKMDRCSLGKGRVPRVKSLSWQDRGGRVRKTRPGRAGENDARSGS